MPNDRTRVFRQVATVEILTLVDPGGRPFTDLSAVMRDAVTSHEGRPDAILVPGKIAVSHPEELVPDGA